MGSVTFVPPAKGPTFTVVPTWTSGPTSAKAIARTLDGAYSSVRRSAPDFDRTTTLPSARAASTRAAPTPLPEVRSRTGLPTVVLNRRAPEALTYVMVSPTA